MTDTTTDKPARKNPDWNEQLKIGSGPTHNGAWHRAIVVGRHLFNTEQWDGKGTLTIEDPYEAHYQLQVHGKQPEKDKDWKVE